MTEELDHSAACFCFTWDNKLVAFMATLPLPSGTIKKAIRGSRTVVLPDFQGFGIGSRITNFLAGIYKAKGYAYYTKTINPRLGEYGNKSANWEGTSFNGKERKDIERCENGDNMFKHYFKRISYCHKYVGKPIYGYESLLENAEQMRINKRDENQLFIPFEFV